MGIRDDRKAATRSEIQLAALDLIEANGLEAVTVAHIAERAGISERTFFRYFGSKEEAALPGQGELIDALVALQPEPGPASGILSELIDVCRAHFAHEVEQRQFRRISRLLLHEPKLLQAVARQELDLVSELRDSLVRRRVLDALRALLVAELVACTWRVSWQCFAQEDEAGNARNPAELFEQAVAGLAEIAGFAGATGVAGKPV